MGKLEKVFEVPTDEDVTWWRASYDNDNLWPYQVIKETKNYVTYLSPRKCGFVEVRESKTGNSIWFRSFEEGASYLIERKRKKIEQLERELEYIKANLAELRTMQEQETTL